MNALIALLPDLELAKPLSHLSTDIGYKFILSMADTCTQTISAAEKEAIWAFYLTQDIQIDEDFCICRWG